MATRLFSSLVLLVLAAVSCFGQIGFPGPLPGTYPGQYPSGGIPIPGGRRTRTTPNNQAPTQTLTGMMRKLSSSELAIDTDDKRTITVTVDGGTRYYDASANSTSPKTARPRDFQPGDRLIIDATQDNQGYYQATKVTLDQHGTADDRAKASAPLDAPSSTGGDDADRPVLHRAPQQNADSTPASPAQRNSDPSNTSSGPTASTSNAASSSDDGYRPSLERGSPNRTGGPINSDSQTASSASRPSIQAQEVNGVTRLPDAPQIDRSSPASRGSLPPQFRDGDPVIEQARDAAFNFIVTLPNYVVKQMTTRYETEAAHGTKTSWQPIDNVTADVVSEKGQESYKNILVNGKPPKDAIEKTGSWSTGEYASVLQDVLSPDTNASFRNKRASTIIKRPSFRYDFTVAQQNSHWHVSSASESFIPEYTGSIWIDKETYRVLRIELSAQKFPARFPLDTVESSVDYDFVSIGTEKYLLPVHSEALSCVRGTSDCSRNVIDFRNYRKFTADTSITFEPER